MNNKNNNDKAVSALLRFDQALSRLDKVSIKQVKAFDGKRLSVRCCVLNFSGHTKIGPARDHCIAYLQGGIGNALSYTDEKGVSYTQNTSTSAIIPSRTRITLFSKQPVEMLYLQIEENALKAFAKDKLGILSNIQINPSIGVDDAFIKALVPVILRELKTDLNSSRFILDNLGASVSNHLLRAYSNAADEMKKVSGSSENISSKISEKASSYIRENVGSDISVQDIARHVGLSSSHFTKVFKSSTGLTPYRYLMEQRVTTALDMMVNEQTSLDDIANKCGFSSVKQLTLAMSKKA